MSTAKKWFLAWVISSFIGVISFFQINSSWADKNNFNGILGWLGIGIAFCIIGAFCLYKVTKNADGGGGSSIQ